MLNNIIRFFLDNKLIAGILLIFMIIWGLVTVPFNWNLPLPSDPVSVDAIPDIGENQQIVFTEWAGRSPQDIDDQIGYPLTTALMGIPGVKTIRSTSMFGVSSIYVIFEDNIEFYWSRARILEKLNALPAGLLPAEVQPALGPDATALGQIFWYTLEGRDENGNPTGGWDPHELRSIQDFYVKYGLAAAEGVAEVASIGGYVKEYQVDVNPDALILYDIGIGDVVRAVQESNLDVGARTIEMNRVEYLVRGLGFIRSTEDLEEAVITVRNTIPVRIKDVGRVSLGPAQRRGALDKTGAEAVGGVAVSRYGANPMQVIDQIKLKIDEISPGLPSRTLEDGTVSRVTIVPFYDRSTLIRETLGTLQEALTLQILITIIVIVVMVMHLRTSALISGLLPVSVLLVFVAMRYFGIEANIVALAGIAIAIGTMVDMGIILTENMLRHLEEAPPDESRRDVVFRAASEVSPAILTAVATTIISFLPVFFMEAAEGKLFRPLAYTKTFALISAILVTLLLIPPLAHLLFSKRREIRTKFTRFLFTGILGLLALVSLFHGFYLAAFVLAVFSAGNLVSTYAPEHEQKAGYAKSGVVIFSISWILAQYWLPLGPSNSVFVNFLFVVLLIALVLGTFKLFIHFYERMLRWCLLNKWKFLALPAFILLLGWLNWQGTERTFGWVVRGFDQINVDVRQSSWYSSLYHAFPGLGKEFMPALDEGSFLLMPTTMPHAGMEEVLDQVRKMDMSVASIPEVLSVIGKIGRAETALDPAPIGMFENLILYKSEYKTDVDGNRLRFRVDASGSFQRDENGELIPDSRGRYYRQWRDEIRSPDDIWNEILKASNIPGATSAPKLQPIETRLVMLQTGMRAPMGVKVSGADLESIQSFALDVERILKEVPGVKQSAVFADRVVGKPYLEISWDRQALARYGISVMQAQSVLEASVGGGTVSTTVEGRERYPIRVRYPREFRDNPDVLSRVMVRGMDGVQVPLGQLARIEYVRGPMEIRSENTFLIGYVIFDREANVAELTAVNNARDVLSAAVASGNLNVPDGVSYSFTGTFENQVRAEKRLSFLIPVVLMSIFLMLYLQFRSTATTLMIFSGIAVAWAGGFIMLGLYAQPWFMDFSLFGTNMRDLFQMGTVNLSVAVWVGFIALFGIAVDDGVVMATYLSQQKDRVYLRNGTSNQAEAHENALASISEKTARIHDLVVEAGMKRIRPCLMTSATTILALLPILTSTGRGSDIMVPMAIPALGGMTIQLITLFVVPVLYALYLEKNSAVTPENERSS